jgi:hypothetical protein
MSNNAVASYPHRRKLDGSFDLICLNCLATIAPANQEAESAGRDWHHVCHSFSPMPTDPQLVNG